MNSTGRRAAELAMIRTCPRSGHHALPTRPNAVWKHRMSTGLASRTGRWRDTDDFVPLAGR